MREHVARQHGWRWYACALCTQDFALERDLQRHVRKWHDDASVMAIAVALPPTECVTMRHVSYPAKRLRAVFAAFCMTCLCIGISLSFIQE